MNADPKTKMGLLLLLVAWLLLGLLPVPGDRGAAAGKATSNSDPDKANEAVVLMRRYLASHEYRHAYDAALAAMWLNPSSHAVFQAALEFVCQAIDIQDGEGESAELAHDLYRRASDLVPYLPLDQMALARDAHIRLGSKLAEKDPLPKLADPLSNFELRLKAATQPVIPVVVRQRILQELATELESQGVQRATEIKDKTFWNRWQELKNKHDEAEKGLLAAIYEAEVRPRLVEWTLRKTKPVLSDAQETPLDQIDTINERLEALLKEGQQLARDIGPYVEAGVKRAVLDDEENYLGYRLNRLRRLREWNLNREALGEINRLAGTKDVAPLDKLRQLAKLDEGRLSAFVAQRFGEVWKQEFEKCNTDDKVEATKARILGEYQR